MGLERHAHDPRPLDGAARDGSQALIHVQNQHLRLLGSIPLDLLTHLGRPGPGPDGQRVVAADRGVPIEQAQIAKRST